MSAQKALDPIWQELADKIFSELPEELAAASHFFMDDKGESLILDFAVILSKSDYPLLISIIKKYNGEFANKKVGGKDSPYFVISKATAEPSLPQERRKLPSEMANEATAQREREIKEKAPAPEKTISQQEQTKAFEQPFKQPSPISLYRGKYCSTCEDQGTCRLPTNTGHMQLCVRVLELQFLDGISERLFKLGQTLEGLFKQFSQQPLPSQPKPSAPQSFSQPQKVQRDTRPTEGFDEDGLIWVKVFEPGTANLKYLKAYEKDNQGRQRFKDLADWITKKGDKSFANLHFLGVECQVFLWNFNQGPSAIGKSKCRSKEHS